METQIFNLLKDQPLIITAVLIFLALKGVIELFNKIKELKPNKHDKLSKLLTLKENLKGKDPDLGKFLEERIREELFGLSTGLSRNYEVNKELVLFYTENSAIVSWNEIRKVASNFKLEKEKLTFTKRTLIYKFMTMLTYLFFGSAGLLSSFMFIYGIQEDKITFQLGIMLFILFISSMWMIGQRMRENYLRKKFENMGIIY